MPAPKIDFLPKQSELGIGVLSQMKFFLPSNCVIFVSVFNCRDGGFYSFEVPKCTCTRLISVLIGRLEEINGAGHYCVQYNKANTKSSCAHQVKMLLNML